jgi:hypothetical protein
MEAPYRKALPTPFFCLMKKLTVIGINGYTQGVRQVAKPTPKAIKKKLNNDFSSSGFSAEFMVETEVSEESEAVIGVEIALETESVFFVASVSEVVAMAVVGVVVVCVFTDDSDVVCADTDNGESVLSFTWFSAWSSLFFFQNPNWNQLLLPI